MDYVCYYCKTGSQEINEQLDHTVQHHPFKQIKIKCKTINDRTGHFAYQTRTFEIIPGHTLNDNEKLIIDTNTWEVYIEKDAKELTPEHSRCMYKDHDSQRNPTGTGNGKHLQNSNQTPKNTYLQRHGDENEETQNQSLPDLNTKISEQPTSPLSKKSKFCTPKGEPENLDIDDESHNFISEIIDSVPSVVKAMKNAGQLETWVKLHRLIRNQTFPFGNIAFLLFMDVCKFWDNANSSSMRYSETVKKFWRIGYRIFHGKWLRFMGGPKHGGSLIGGECDRGSYDPKESSINFAIPVRSILSSDLSPVNASELKPGIINPLVERVAEHSSEAKTYKLCVDGKKINAATNGKRGEIDLWGYESKPTLKEKQTQLMNDRAVVKDAASIISEASICNKSMLSDLDYTDCVKLKPILFNVIRLLSNYIRTLREIVVVREATKERLKSSVEGDWRKSKYVFVISGLVTYVYDIRSCIKNLLASVDQICQIICEINGSTFIKVGSVNMSAQANYLHLKDNKIDSDNDEELRFLKQRSDKWHAIRNDAVITGSTMNDALGLSTLKKQQEHFDNVKFGKPKPDPSPHVKEMMAYGTENERHAIATLVGKVLPVYGPDLVYVEEGCYRLSIGGKNMIISPDGSCRSTENDNVVYGVECKCPYPGKKHTTQVHYKLPKYYVTQVLSEMFALQTDKLFLICYSAESSTVLQVKFDKDLWDEIQTEICCIYGPEPPIRPSKRSESSKRLQLKIDEFVEQKVEFICEVLSLQSVDCSCTDKPDDKQMFCCHTSNNQKLELTLNEAQECLHNCNLNVESAYKLTKAKATEFLGFMISDLDREYKSEQLHSIPVAYGLKGYSMPTETLRRMIEDVLSHCKKRGLYVPVVSFDGQWCKLAVRDRDENPLTVLQLQKTVFAGVRRLSKGEIIKSVSESNVVTIKENATMTDLAELVDIEITEKPRRIYVRPLKSEKIIFVSKNAYDMIRNKTIIQNIENLNETVECAADQMSTMPENVIEHLTTEIIESIDSTTQYDGDSEQTQSIDIDISDTFLNEENEPVIEHEVNLNSHENIDVAETHTVATESFLDECDFKLMLSALQGNEKANQKGKWNIPIIQFKTKLCSAIQIDKSFLAREIQICLKPVIGKIKSKGVKIQLGNPKYQLVNTLSAIVGDGTTKEIKSRKKSQKVKTLKFLAKQAVQKISKDHLNVVVSESIFPDELSKWYASSPYGRAVIIEDVDTTSQKNWYSRPEFNPPQDNYVFMILDAYHQMCGLRRLVCANGIPAANVSRKGWQKVAEESESNHSGLNRALVNDLIDRQSIGYAVKTFSEGVEDALRNIGYDKEAEFCRLVRKWYEAEDEPGVSSLERCKARLELRRWLLSNANFGKFPPYGAYVNDVPIVLYEGLLTGIERRLQLYPFTRAGTYNVRSIGSLDIENFFGSFQDIDPWGTGVLRPDSIATALSIAVELTEARLNPERYISINSQLT